MMHIVSSSVSRSVYLCIILSTDNLS